MRNIKFRLTMNFLFHYFCFLLLPGGVPWTLAQAETSQPETPEIKEDQPLGKTESITIGVENWWKRGAYSKDQLPKHWLWRLEGEAGYSKFRGNIKRLDFEGKARVIARKRNLTNQFSYTHYQFKERVIINSQTEVENKTLNLTIGDKLIMDLSQIFFGQLGFLYEEFSNLQVRERNTYYAGVGVTLLKTDHHSLSTEINYSHIDQEFGMGAAPPVGNNYLYLEALYQFALNEDLELEMGLNFFSNVDDHRDHRILSQNKLSYKIRPHLGVGAEYSTQYNHLPPAGTRTTDERTMMKVMLNI